MELGRVTATLRLFSRSGTHRSSVRTHEATIRGPRLAAPGSLFSLRLPFAYGNLTVTYATDDGAPFFLGTNPTRTLVLNGRPLR
jgi:hypothetical protein